jgi:hypothetical protein
MRITKDTRQADIQVEPSEVDATLPEHMTEDINPDDIPF